LEEAINELEKRPTEAQIKAKIIKGLGKWINDETAGYFNLDV
jgi:hypothetical protein